MRRLIWLCGLGALPLITLQLDAARWISFLAAAPLLVFLLVDDEEMPDENLLGEGFQRFRGWLIPVMLIAGVILGGGLLLVARSMM